MWLTLFSVINTRYVKAAVTCGSGRKLVFPVSESFPCGQQPSRQHFHTRQTISHCSCIMLRVFVQNSARKLWCFIFSV